MSKVTRETVSQMSQDLEGMQEFLTEFYKAQQRLSGASQFGGDCSAAADAAFIELQTVCQIITGLAPAAEQIATAEGME